MLQGLGSLDPMQLVKPESYGSGLVVHVGLCGPGGPTVSGILRGATPRLGVARVRSFHPSKGSVPPQRQHKHHGATVYSFFGLSKPHAASMSQHSSVNEPLL